MLKCGWTLKKKLPFDDNNNKFFEEDFPNKAISYVEDAAENWALGIKKLEGSIQLGLL